MCLRCINYNIAIAINYDGSLEIIQLVEEQESGHHTVVACNKWVSVLVSFFSIRCLCVGWLVWSGLVSFCNNFVAINFYSWTICRCLHCQKIQTDTVQLMGSMGNSDHVYLHQCNVRVLWHCSMDSVFAFFWLSLYFICWDCHHFKLCPYSLVPTNFNCKGLQVITSVHSYSGMSHDRASFGCTDSVGILFTFSLRK